MFVCECDGCTVCILCTYTHVWCVGMKANTLVLVFGFGCSSVSGGTGVLTLLVCQKHPTTVPSFIYLFDFLFACFSKCCSYSDE